MKKLIKISAVSLCLVLVLSAAAVMTGCGGGAGNPTRAARNILNAVSSQNPRRMASAANLDESARDALIQEYENRTPDRRQDERAWEDYQARNRALGSIRFVSAAYDTIGAAATSVTVSVTFSYQVVEVATATRVRRTVTVPLNFNREAGGSWYSASGNRTTIEGAGRLGGYRRQS